jgi:hypothetical protein
MINVQKPIAVSFAVGILIAWVLAMSAPASAKGSGGSSGSAKGGGSSSGSKKPGHPPPPVFLEGSGAGRAVGSGCSISRKPVTNASGTVVSYRRVQVCN